MNEAIMLMMLCSGRCVVTQESQSSTTRPPAPPLVTLTQRALLTLVGLALPHSGSAVPCSRSFRDGKSLLSSSPERSQTEIGDPDLCFPKPAP